MENQTKRTGIIRSMNAARNEYTKLLVREFDDGSIEYMVGDSARRRDGWATVPTNVLPEIEWD
jgi:hypothetical protein